MGLEIFSVIPFPEARQFASELYTGRGIANPIPPRIPRTPIPAFDLLGPPGGPLCARHLYFLPRFPGICLQIR